MSVPECIDPSKQKLSLESLRAELLKSRIPITENFKPQQIKAYTELNRFIETRVNSFVDTVLKKIYQESDFNPNKIGWYFEIYKEGVESKKPKNGLLNNLPQENIDALIAYFKGKTITDFCNESSSFLSDCFAILSSWYRDILLENRNKTIYASDDPLDWIRIAESEEGMALSKNIQHLNPQVSAILDVIQLLKSKKI